MRPRKKPRKKRRLRPNGGKPGRARSGPDGGRTCVVLHADGAGRQRRQARAPEARLAEAVALARSIGLAVRAAEVVPSARIVPALFFGRGTVARIASVIRGDGADGNGEAGGSELVIVNGTLTPVQQRNLENEWGCKVIDRTGLILEIFGARAQSREGRMQVELAALSYQRSRLVRSWTHLERQRGGYGFLGGPGETQIEADRRLISKRIGRLQRALRKRETNPSPASPGAPARPLHGDRPGRLYERRKIDPVQPSHVWRRLGPVASVRDIGSNHAGDEVPLRPTGGVVRYGWLHRRSSARVGRGLSRHPGRGDRVRSHRARARRRPSRDGGPEAGCGSSPRRTGSRRPYGGLGGRGAQQDRSLGARDERGRGQTDRAFQRGELSDLGADRRGDIETRFRFTCAPCRRGCPGSTYRSRPATARRWPGSTTTARSSIDGTWTIWCT